MRSLFLKLLICCIVMLSLDYTAQAQDAKQKRYLGIVGNGSLYFSWGYNTEWYTKSNVHVSQPSLSNDYQLHSVKAHDRRGWDDDFFHTALTVPQYNYRLGYFFNEKQDFAFEINFDHTKYIITDGQQAQLKGKLGGKEVDQMINYSGENGFYYFLNNGANFLLFNLVKRFDLYHTDNKFLKVDLLTKAGIGPVIPHVENQFFGKDNEPGFQLGGWNTAVETALRVTAFKYVYLEFAQKAVYARYSNLKVYEGRARQAFGCYELVLSLGFTLPTGKHNPGFSRQSAVGSTGALPESTPY